MEDKFGRTIDYLRISITDKCNLRCIYCMPAEGVKLISHDEILRIEEIAQIVRVAAELGVRNVRLTGGEPLVRRGVVDLVRMISQTPGIEDVSLTTNGLLLPKMAADLKAAGLSRVNISLDTLDPEQYHYITRIGNIDSVLAGIDAALETGFDPVKINMVVVRRLNQDFLAFAKLSMDRPLHVRFIEYMPIGESGGALGTGWDETDVIPSNELRDLINQGAQAEGLPSLEPMKDANVPAGKGPAKYYAFPGAQGTVGFITAMSNHFCANCNRLRLTADGKLRMCLFSDAEVDVRTALRESGDQGIRLAFEEALAMKPEAHQDIVGTVRKMSQIGG